MSKRIAAQELSQSVGQLVTPDYRRGAVLGDVSGFRSESSTIRLDFGGVQRLGQEAIQRFGSNDADADAWLAPRLHSLVRLTRAQASSHGLWRWMALEVLPEYVRHRWSKNGEVTENRYLGGSNFIRRNAISRLWWGSEIVRNGADYTDVEDLFRNSGVEQYVLDSRFGHLRASAIAFARVALGRTGLRELLFDETKELSKRANLLLSATCLESLAPDRHDDVDDIDGNWLAEEPDVDDLVKRSLKDIKGPHDQAASDNEIHEYETWYTDIANQIVNPASPIAA